jgi:hypothetical protein
MGRKDRLSPPATRCTFPCRRLASGSATAGQPAGASCGKGTRERLSRWREAIEITGYFFVPVRFYDGTLLPGPILGR